MTLMKYGLRVDDSVTTTRTLTMIFCYARLMFARERIYRNLPIEISLDKNFLQGMYFVNVSSDQLQWIKALVITQ